MKFVLIIFILYSAHFLAQNTKAFNDSIQNIVHNELVLINSSFTPTDENYININLNENKEVITIYKIDYKTNIYLIYNYKKQTPISFIFYETNKKLRYAKEVEADSYISCLSTTLWQCEYYFNNDRLIYYESLGHGKSEDENWNPDLEIKKQYKYYSKLSNKN